MNSFYKFLIELNRRLHLTYDFNRVVCHPILELSEPDWWVIVELLGILFSVVDLGWLDLDAVGSLGGNVRCESDFLPRRLPARRHGVVKVIEV